MKLSISPINPSQIVQSSESQITSFSIFELFYMSIRLIISRPLSRLSRPKPTNPTERPKQETQNGAYLLISSKSNIF